MDSLLSDADKSTELALAPLQKQIDELKSQLLASKNSQIQDKQLLSKELKDMRRQINDVQRQVTKLCLIFSGPAIDQMLDKILKKKSRNVFGPTLDLIEKRFRIYIKDYEIHDVHIHKKIAKSENTGKIGKKRLYSSVIVKFNQRHLNSSYM